MACEPMACVTVADSASSDKVFDFRLTCMPAVLRSLITDVWARVGGEWRLLLRHTSAATRPDSPDRLRQ